MAQTGSAWAKAETNSTSRPSGSAAAKASAASVTRGSIQASPRGVKVWLTSLRCLVCTGGSVVPRPGVYGQPRARIAATWSATSGGGCECLCTAEE